MTTMLGVGSKEFDPIAINAEVQRRRVRAERLAKAATLCQTLMGDESGKWFDREATALRKKKMLRNKTPSTTLSEDHTFSVYSSVAENNLSWKRAMETVDRHHFPSGSSLTRLRDVGYFELRSGATGKVLVLRWFGGRWHYIAGRSRLADASGNAAGQRVRGHGPSWCNGRL